MKITLKYRLAKRILKILACTWRINYTGNLLSESGIVVFWHNDMLPALFAFKSNNSKFVLSRSKDGDILSYLLSLREMDFIRGSSSKGGKEVMAQIVENSSQSWILMTPDGPRGPRHKMKSGAVVAAQRAQVPLYICKVKISSKYIFEKSWDKFVLPLPFAKIDISYSEPHFFEPELSHDDIASKINEIENKMNIIDN